MPCNCGGGGTAANLPAATSVTAAPATPQGTVYRVTYPNGVTGTFRSEWQAHQALAISGGTLNVVTPETG